MPSGLDPQILKATRTSNVHTGTIVGRWMQQNLDPEVLLATNTAGAVAYFLKLKIVDMMGLNTPEIASRREVPASWKGIEKGDGAYVLSRRPDYIQFGSSSGSAGPVFLSDVEIYANAEFWRHYQLVRYRIDDDTQLLLYERLETPRTEPLSAVKRRKIERVVAQAMKRSRFRY